MPEALPSRPPRRLRRLVRLVLGTVAGILGLLVAALAYVAFVGVTLDASFLRGELAGAFSQALRREVRFDGPAQLEISGEPWLRIGGLHVADPGGFQSGTLASLGEARLAVDLWQLLRKRVHIRELSGSGLRVKLVQQRDGSNNWKFDFPRAAEPEPAAPSSDTTAAAKDAALMLDIRKVTLDQLAVEYVGRDGRSHFFDLAKLEGSSPQGEPLRVTMRGAVEKSFPYDVAFTGGPLSALIGSSQPWPMKLRVEFLSTVLNLDGHVQGTGGALDFSMGTENLSELERLLQDTFPKVGATAIACHVKFDPTRVEVTKLTGVMGRTSLRGELTFDNRGERPALTGRLALPALDLRPFLNDNAKDDEEAPKSFRDTYRELAQATFSLKALRNAEVDLELAVDRWLSLPGNVRDAALTLRLHDGRLEAPVRATVTDVALQGMVRADGAADPPKFAFSLGTEDSDLGGLAELLSGARGIQGRLARFALDVKAEGDQGAELVRSLDVRLAIDRGRFSYGNFEDSRPVAFTLDRFVVALPAGRPLSGELQGSLLAQPIRAKLSGGTLEKVMEDERTPLDFEVRSGTVRAHLQGILQAPAADRGPALAFDLTADRTSDVTRWLGLPAGASARVSLKGKASMTETDWRIDDLAFQLGRSRVDAALARTTVDGRPLVQLKLDAALVDVAELQSLLPPPAAKPANKPVAERPVLDIPVLPQGIDLGDADATIRVRKVTGTPLEPRDIAFDGRVRDGAMQPSSFSAVIADVAFRGALSLDLRTSQPRSSLWLLAEDVDVGRLMRRFGLASAIEAQVGAIRLSLDARSSLLGEMLANSELVGNVEDARVTLRDPNTKAEANIRLDQGVLRAGRGAPVRLSLDGSLDRIPIDLDVETANLVQLIAPRGSIPFRLTAVVPDLTVKLDGALAKPVGEGDIELSLDARGTRFDKLNGLVRAQLPPWGPYALSGRFRMDRAGYEVSSLRLAVGSSTLLGRGALRTAGTKPRLDVALTAPEIQLDDFAFGDWSPVEKKPEKADEKPLSVEELKAKAAAASDEAQKLLSPAVLRRQDARLTVQVDRVLSGKDPLGGGRLEATLENGRAEIGPVEVRIPGGSARLALGYEPTDTDVRVDTRIDVERFDYGILARRIKPETDFRGQFSLRMDVQSRARYLSDILKSGTGRIEFAVWPENMRAGIFDLWAVNLLMALVPAVDPGGASNINCALGRFELKDGQLVDRTIVMDTSRMRVTGHGRADFRDEEVALRMQPQAKVPQFLSLATPIQVTGKFGKFEIGVSAGDVLGTLGRLASSIFWVPVQKLLSKEVPADGRDVCNVTLAPIAWPDTPR